MSILRTSISPKINKQQLLIGAVSLAVMFVFMFLLFRGEKLLQAYLFKINETACIYYEQYGNVWILTLLISLVFSIFLSCTLSCIILYRKSIKTALKFDAVILAALAISLYVTLPQYAYIKREGIYMRNTYSEGERYYPWSNVERVNVRSFNTSKDGEHIVFIFDFTDGNVFSVKYIVNGSKQQIKMFGKLIEDKKLKLDISPMLMGHYMKIIDN